MAGSKIMQAEAKLANGDLKGALREIDSKLAYYDISPEDHARLEVVAKRIAEEGDERRRQKAEHLIDRMRRKVEAQERARKEREEAAEAKRRAEEDQYRSAAKERLDTLHATRGTRDITSPRSFEYAVMELPRQETAEYLNKAGSLGWELVSALPSSDEQHALYMKRDAWLATDSASGRLVANAAPTHIAGAAATGGLAFAGFYYESGPDLDTDGDVDGGLFDNIQNLFG